MGQNKKYYWLKLKENFFEEKQIKYLRSLPDGDKIVIAYLKMQLKSLKTEGFIKYDSILPSNIDELAMVLDENTNIIKLMIGALQKVNAVEILDDGSFYMIAMQDLIGKEGESAERVRRFRERQEQKLLQCNGDVTKCNTEIEKEKEIDIDIDKEKDIETEKNIKKEKKKKETEFDSVINENFTDEELKQTVYEFIKMRKAIKKPLTTRGLELMIKKLYNLSTNITEQIEILNNSIMNNWQGIFPLKKEIKQSNKKGSFDDFKQLWEEARIEDEQKGNNTDNNIFGG
jgi:predicted phage replisome organizer